MGEKRGIIGENKYDRSQRGMKSIEKRDSVKLYAGVLLCTIMSVVAVIIVGNRDIIYDRFVQTLRITMRLLLLCTNVS